MKLKLPECYRPKVIDGWVFREFVKAEAKASAFFMISFLDFYQFEWFRLSEACFLITFLINPN
ncbi:hypothetical protein D1013_19200 [Euzebyella marina]|uniref:Uncharacterized protein n=1 Tax=Euzebyella marina TaxID=1761453 RepID=A0A3G2LAY4_9FLAO|nr:hypothetical protein D1013_19200 [Euzebyella marina]